MSHSNQNIYQMYASNGNKTGFYVIRNSWSNYYAKITEINGQSEGELPGDPPYHNNPKVYAELYSIKTGKCIKKREEITCPGTYGYFLMDSNAIEKL